MFSIETDDGSFDVIFSKVATAAGLGLNQPRKQMLSQILVTQTATDANNDCISKI